MKVNIIISRVHNIYREELLIICVYVRAYMGLNYKYFGYCYKYMHKYFIDVYNYLVIE